MLSSYRRYTRGPGYYGIIETAFGLAGISVDESSPCVTPLACLVSFYAVQGRVVILRLPTHYRDDSVTICPFVYQCIKCEDTSLAMTNACKRQELYVFIYVSINHNS